MILIFGGTTEGRNVATVCDEAAKPYYYSTKTNRQKIKNAYVIPVSGGMDDIGMIDFCRGKNIRLIIDAGHPFAEVLHRNIAKTAEKLDIPVIRYERIYPERNENLLWFDNYDDAIDYLIKHKIENLLALTGVNTIVKLKPYWQNHECRFRILDMKESKLIAQQAEFPANKIAYYNHKKNEYALLNNLKSNALMIKESGYSGGFNDKVQAAIRLNIPVLVIKRPIMPPGFITVYGNNGLRKAIEKNLPDFFELKTGYTTGTCATAATKAALTALLTGKSQETVTIELPDGEPLEIAVAWTRTDDDTTSCAVIKDAGDDPDITNGLEIISTVRLNGQTGGLRFLKGEGVGIVTLPGLDIKIGEPAINAIPRAMIRSEVYNILSKYECKSGVDITISVPLGKDVATKTFNSKLGIEGGISIIGTSGIVKPFSSDAFINSIRREMQVAKALGCNHIILNSGAKSERFIKQRYSGYPAQAFIHYGNFIGKTICMASELGFKQVTLGVMIGKAVKLAEGALDTHSKKTVMNTDFIAGIAVDAGCTKNTVNAIRNIKMARLLWDIIPANESVFFSSIVNKCYETCKPLIPDGELEIILIDENTIFHN